MAIKTYTLKDIDDDRGQLLSLLSEAPYAQKHRTTLRQQLETAGATDVEVTATDEVCTVKCNFPRAANELAARVVLEDVWGVSLV